MKAKNYRIGNLVKYEDRVFRIHSLAEELPTLDTPEFGIGVVDWNSLKPSELTEEWLYKFGFTRNGMECNIPLPLGTGLYLSIEDDGETCIVRRHFCDGVLTSDFDHAYVKHCKYVHELQNLFFALTGTELELKDESSTCG